MTEIAFHFNIADRFLYACRLLRKAYVSGAQVAVTAEPEVLDELDQFLWSFSATEFLPHCRTGSEASLLATKSVLLLLDSPAACPHHGVLVNLGMEVPAEFERFERFIEVVTQGSSERLAARVRWKHYADRGYSMQRHDIMAAGEGA
jgi:DNA polymerase III subunit chi